MVQNHNVLTRSSNKDYFKSSCFNKVSVKDAFDISVKMLQRMPVSISQTRRINKLLGTETQEQTFTLKGRGRRGDIPQ
jgi:hypothetical protein